MLRAPEPRLPAHSCHSGRRRGAWRRAARSRYAGAWPGGATTPLAEGPPSGDAALPGRRLQAALPAPPPPPSWPRVEAGGARRCVFGVCFCCFSFCVVLPVKTIYRALVKTMDRVRVQRCRRQGCVRCHAPGDQVAASCRWPPLGAARPAQANRQMMGRGRVGARNFLKRSRARGGGRGGGLSTLLCVCFIRADTRKSQS